MGLLGDLVDKELKRWCIFMANRLCKIVSKDYDMEWNDRWYRYIDDWENMVRWTLTGNKIIGQYHLWSLIEFCDRNEVAVWMRADVDRNYLCFFYRLDIYEVDTSKPPMEETPEKKEELYMFMSSIDEPNN